MSIKLFGQGSYANDTNVRLNSDIDINVCYEDAFYFDLPEGKARVDFGLETVPEYSHTDFKDDVEKALVNYFGRATVQRRDKCITVAATATRIQTDVVPTWRHRRYSQTGAHTDGVCFYSEGLVFKTSYPEQHIENAIQKNANTSKRYKRTTRIFRKLRYRMIEDGEPVSGNITSFLLECLLWNVPANVYNNTDTWTERIKQCIQYIYSATLSDERCGEWGGRYQNYSIYSEAGNGQNKM